MPLSEGSKSKVGLASLSATTAAAAETLWAKSRKSSKRVSSAPAVADGSSSRTTAHPRTVVVEKQCNNTHTTAASAKEVQVPAQLHPHQPLDRQEFRRKFLEGLQFYCENSSLILNSDLPADLIEFVTSHGFSVESLGIILELKKSSSAFSAYVTKKEPPSTVLGVKAAGDKQAREQNFSEISRRLLQHWMSADSCAEAFVSLSLGEEIPGLIAECANFQRILFSIPDYFHLGVKDFLSFLLGQVLLAIYALTFGVRTSSQPKDSSDENEPQENIKVRTQGLAGCLERIFMRYFSDAEYFHESISEHQNNEQVARNPFQNFISELAELCRTDFIGRRLTSKIFLHLGSHAASKLAKVVFSCKDIDDDNSVASIVFYPRVEFVEKSSQWKYIIRTLPLKTVTKSKGFWSHWAKYIAEDFSYCVDFWQECVEHWIILNKTSSVDVHRLYSASLAVAAFARNLKLNLKKQEDKDQIDKYIAKLDAGKVLQNIIHSLESVNEDKRACGMALGQVVADLQALSWSSSTTTTTSEKIEPLKFESKSLRFVDIVDFYENGLKEDEESESETVKTTKSNPVEVLDSDDDVEEGNECEDDGFPVMQDEYVTEDPKIAIDPRILTLRARKRKIPMYFSEIVEALLESSKDEDEAEILRCIVVLKIPVLLSMSVNIDVQMVAKITRCLADMEDGTCLEIPVLFALYELFMKHPFDVADTIGHIVFDRTHYALGQRIMNLTRLTQIVMLSSKQLCYNCFREKLKKHEKELRGIYPEFFCKYFEARIKLWACTSCRKEIKELKEEPSQQAAAASHAESNEILTWRQIIDKRLEAKTRYFVTPKHKTPVILPDEYSNKLLPILWSCIANRLTSTAGYYLDNEERIRSGNMHDMFMIKIFQYLARCVFGSSGANCNHIANVASHAGELITHFVRYEDAIVRRTVLSLLGVILSMGEGKVFIIEALSSQGNIVEKVDLLLESEQDDENRKFLKYIQRYVAEATTLGLLSDLSQNTGKSPFSVL